MLKGRDLSNLGKDHDAKLALEIILECFGEGYLKSKNRHRLPKLWCRADRLSTVELFTLGKCLLKLKKCNPLWLKGTIRSIKKHPAKSSQGFFTEIIYFGMFSLYNSEIIPAENSNPGYDFSTLLPNGLKQFISIKNIDASDSQKSFQKNSRKFRIKWIEKLRTYNVNLGIRIVASRNLSGKDFEQLVIKVKSLNLNSTSTSYSMDSEVSLHIFELPASNYSLSPKYISDMVQVFCPPPKSEYKRYLKKIRDAIVNISKHTAYGNDVSRIIFMRMHVNADYNYISEQVKKLVNEKDAGVDCIVCYQPSYVRDKQNNSLLNHCFKFEASANFAIKMGGSDHYQVVIPIGSMSENQSDVKIIDIESGENTRLPPSDYFFQQGDFYLQSKKDKDGSIYCDDLGSPALGVRKHGVFFNMIIENKTTPKFEELLII